MHSELLKVRTTRGWYAYVLAIVALGALGVAGTIGPAPELERPTLDWQLGLIDTAGVAGLFALIFGIMITTTEFRHGTITPTFLAMPLRERVVAAKAVASVPIALGFALLAFAVIAAIAVPWLSLTDVELQLFGREALQRCGQIALAVTLLGLLGVALGNVVHSQVAALVGTLVWLLLVETLVGGLLGLVDLDGLVGYLPFRAVDAVDGGGGEDVLGFWAGLAVVLAYIVVVGALGMGRARRRDIT